MLEKIAKWLTRKPKLVAMMAVLMLIPAAIGYISTRINYDILSYLPEDLESSHGEKLLEEPFKMAATSMLVVESMPAGYTNSLLNDIKAIDGVSNAIWISNLMGIQIPTDMIPANFRDMFFAGDATMMIIQYSHPGASDETMEAIEQVRRACNEKCFLAGFSVVIKDTRDLMDSELPIFVGLAVLLALVAMMVTLELRRRWSAASASSAWPSSTIWAPTYSWGRFPTSPRLSPRFCSWALPWTIPSSSTTGMRRSAPTTMTSGTPWRRRWLLPSALCPPPVSPR